MRSGRIFSPSPKSDWNCDPQVCERCNRCNRKRWGAQEERRERAKFTLNPQSQTFQVMQDRRREEGCECAGKKSPVFAPPVLHGLEASGFWV